LNDKRIKLARAPTFVDAFCNDTDATGAHRATRVKSEIVTIAGGARSRRKSVRAPTYGKYERAP
jgi:hypothetical protein